MAGLETRKSAKVSDIDEPAKKPIVYRKTCFVIAAAEPMPKPQRNQLLKFGIVITGATASFDSLVKAVLEPNFLKDLASHGYTNLVVQHGEDHNGIVKHFDKFYPAGSNDRHGIWVDTFDYKRGGLHEEIMKAQGRAHDATEGMVIAHAGSGTIMEALRAGVPIIVVANSTLLHNHQKELAEALDSSGLAIEADVRELDRAILKLESRRGKEKPWPLIDEAQSLAAGKGITGVLDEEMGYVD